MKKYLLFFLFITTALTQYYFPIEIGGKTGINLPGMNNLYPPYDNNSSYHMHCTYNFQPGFDISLNYTFAPKEAIASPPQSDLELVFIELARYKQSRYKLTTYSLLGVGKITRDINNEFGVVFGLGVQYPINDRTKINFSIKDHMTELSVPFVSFPDFKVTTYGGGEHFTQISIGLTFGIGKEKFVKKSRSCQL